MVLRDPTRSPLSTAEVPRVELHLVFPRVAADLDILMLLQRIRTTSLGSDAFYRLRSIFGADDTMILEVGNSYSVRHY